MSNTTRTTQHLITPLLCLLLAACSSGAPEREVNYGDITRSPELRLPPGLSAPDTRSAMDMPREVDQLATSDSAGLLVLPPPSELAAEEASVAEAEPNKVERARVEEGMEGLRVSVDEGFARAWRHTRIALDAIGVVVEEWDRSQGLFHISVIGMLKKRRNDVWTDWFSGGDDQKRVKRRVQLLRASEESTFIYLYDDQDRPMDEDQTRPLLELLAKQLNG